VDLGHHRWVRKDTRRLPRCRRSPHQHYITDNSPPVPCLLSDMDFYHNFPAGSASATCFAKCIATAPQSLAASLESAPASTVAIQPLPPHLHSVGKALSHIQWRKIPLDTIRYGEWTLLILNNLMLNDLYDPKAEKGLSASSLSYCFVTAKHPVAYPYMSIPAERTFAPEQFEFHNFTSFLHTFDMKPGARASLLDFWENQMCAKCVLG